MATVNDLLDRLQARGYGFDTEAQQLLMLDTAYGNIENYRRWGFNERTETVPLPAGQANISLTTDLTGDVRFLDAVRRAGGPGLEYVEYQLFRKRTDHGHFTTGEPAIWTRRGDEILVWPVPSETVQLEIDYNQRRPALASLDPEADEIPVPAPYEELIVLGAVKDIAFRERDWDARAAAMGDYAELLSAFMEEHGLKQRQTPDRVKASGFFEAYGVGAP